MEHSSLNMLDLPPEILINIFKFNKRKDFGGIVLCCKQFAAVVKAHQLYFRSRLKNGFLAYPEQEQMLEKLARATENRVVVESPMGSGKTAIMLMLAIQAKCRVLIVINPRIYTSWISEIKKFNLRINQKPEQSDILIAHSKYPKHRDLFHYANSTTDKLPRSTRIESKCCFEHIKHNIAITTPHYVRTWTGYTTSTWIRKTSGVLIVDEAHILLDRFLATFPKIYAFSASPITQFRNDSSVLQIKVPIRSGGYPNIIRKYVHGSLNIAALEKLMEDYDYKQIVVFSGTPLKALRAVCRQLNRQLRDRKAFVFSNTAPTTLARFEKCKKGVLLCNYRTSTEGTNFSTCDCAMFFNVDGIGLESARQCIGRVRRKNNPNKTIMAIFVIGQGRIPYIRARLNAIYALNLKIKGFQKKSNDQMKTIIAKMGKNKTGVGKLNDNDILCIFGQYLNLGEWKPKFIESDFTMPLVQIVNYGIMSGM